jgi:hypothetical protein
LIERESPAASLRTCEITTGMGEGAAAAESINGTKPKGQTVGADARTCLARRTSEC